MSVGQSRRSYRSLLVSVGQSRRSYRSLSGSLVSRRSYKSLSGSLVSVEQSRRSYRSLSDNAEGTACEALGCPMGHVSLGSSGGPVGHLGYPEELCRSLSTLEVI